MKRTYDKSIYKFDKVRFHGTITFSGDTGVRSLNEKLTISTMPEKVDDKYVVTLLYHIHSEEYYQDYSIKGSGHICIGFAANVCKTGFGFMKTLRINHDDIIRAIKDIPRDGTSVVNSSCYFAEGGDPHVVYPVEITIIKKNHGVALISKVVLTIPCDVCDEWYIALAQWQAQKTDGVQLKREKIGVDEFVPVVTMIPLTAGEIED